jgi:hypothetical protein
MRNPWSGSPETHQFQAACCVSGSSNAQPKESQMRCWSSLAVNYRSWAQRELWENPGGHRTKTHQGGVPSQLT